MQIRDFLKESYNDYPGKVSSVVFTPGCNYRCPSCHAKPLLEDGENKPEKDFFEYLDLVEKTNPDWIEGVVLCGGEPTIQPDIIPFARRLNGRDLSVKLDTNGSNPDVLLDLKEEGLVDYVAMDVKAPSRLYVASIGGGKFSIENTKTSILITSQFPDYEFRTTVAPVLREEGQFSFMSVEEIVDTAKLIYDCTGSNQHKYFLQPFVPHKGKGQLIDARLEDFPETSKELLWEMRDAVTEYLPNCEIR